MESSGLVEPPVFRDAQVGIPGALVPGILLASALRGYLHYEVGWLALLGDDVAVAVLVGLRVGVECDQQVGESPVRRRGARFPDDVPLPPTTVMSG